MRVFLRGVSLRGLFLLVTWLLCSQSAVSQQIPEVAFAGFAYSGSASTIATRFPHSVRYEQELQGTGTSIGQNVLRLLDATPPSHLKIVPQIEALKGRDQALAVALVIGAETISVEQFGNMHKLMVLVRGQTMFFDFKSMNVVRAYPISFAYIDLLDHAPTADEVQTRVKLVYQGTGEKAGMLARFSQSIAKAQIPAGVPRFLQVASVQLTPEAMEVLPSYIKSEPGAAETWAADLVSEAISTRAGVPIVPYAKGYAIGNVMSMRVSDGTVFELKLPKPDYEIKVELSGFRKVKFNEVQGGATSYVYGSYARMQIEEPLSGKAYLNTALKNGETRVIPASQRYVDDFPHFYDAVNGLFVKLAQGMDGKGDEKWLRSAASAKDIDLQIASTRELIKQCK
ncbi:hypothetical protein ABIE13_001291 [Ottowia thiooxydans]|uniref:Uncharacterized protein n=1 Tax=Ottowia thiooxydans TaxID=219182 RepID=A0ABV2Q578_9BURK